MSGLKLKLNGEPGTSLGELRAIHQNLRELNEKLDKLISILSSKSSN